MSLHRLNFKLRFKPAVRPRALGRSRRHLVAHALLLAVIALPVLWLLGEAVFGAGGYLALRHEQQTYRGVEAQVNQLRQQNRELNQSVRELSSDPQAIESIARKQLHLTKPGEVVYTFPTKPSAGEDALAYSRAGMRPAR